MMNPFQLLVFDPGGATGWAHYQRYSDGLVLITSGTIWTAEHHQSIDNFITAGAFIEDVPLTVITESFEFRQNPDSAKKRRGLELVSREYIGVMKLICRQTNVKLVQQLPVHAITFMTDEKLEKMGYLKTPLHDCRHENDALRHLFLYLIQTLKMKEWRDKLKL